MSTPAIASSGSKTDMRDVETNKALATSKNLLSVQSSQKTSYNGHDDAETIYISSIKISLLIAYSIVIRQIKFDGDEDQKNDLVTMTSKLNQSCRQERQLLRLLKTSLKYQTKDQPEEKLCTTLITLSCLACL